jgi:uncharacterized protein (DUF697 family)
LRLCAFFTTGDSTESIAKASLARIDGAVAVDEVVVVGVGVGVAANDANEGLDEAPAIGERIPSAISAVLVATWIDALGAAAAAGGGSTGDVMAASA